MYTFLPLPTPSNQPIHHVRTSSTCPILYRCNTLLPSQVTALYQLLNLPHTWLQCRIVLHHVDGRRNVRHLQQSLHIRIPLNEVSHSCTIPTTQLLLEFRTHSATQPPELKKAPLNATQLHLLHELSGNYPRVPDSSRAALPLSAPLRTTGPAGEGHAERPTSATLKINNSRAIISTCNWREVSTQKKTSHQSFNMRLSASTPAHLP